MKPLLKYPGGKTGELKKITTNLPEMIDNYIEPFLGGGAVFFSISAKHYYLNDISQELMLLYEYIKTQDELFFTELATIDSNWVQLKSIAKRYMPVFFQLLKEYRDGHINQLELHISVSEVVQGMNGELDVPLFAFEGIDSVIFKNQLRKNIFDKLKRIKRNEEKHSRLLDEADFFDNIETAFKSAYYMHFRDIYNNSSSDSSITIQRRVAIFFFVREYCFSSMFRFNSKGHFNVPYGGISYNKKSMSMKIKHFKSAALVSKLRCANLHRVDFIEFLKQIPITEDDFLFLDPPYDTVFSEYDKNKFGHNDQIRLANYLLYECKCHYMLVIKKTKFISDLYDNKGLHIDEIDKSYAVSFRNRNKRKVTHLMIRNY